MDELTERARQVHAQHDLGHRLGAWPKACALCQVFAPRPRTAREGDVTEDAELVDRIAEALRRSMARPGYGYIDFTYHPDRNGVDKDGEAEIRGLAEDIVEHLPPQSTPEVTA